MNLKKQRICLLIIVFMLLASHLFLGIEGMKEYETLEHQIKRQAAQLKDKQQQIEVLEIMLEQRDADDSTVDADEPEYIGTFTVTHYCPCVKCCNKEDGITYTGTHATEGRTVAVDPEVIPLGSTVIIDGQEYIAEDVGGAIKGNRIDKFMLDHTAALRAGIVQAEVYIGG